MTINNTAGLLAVALLATPLAGFAATYHYVDTSGTVQTITADSATDAYAKSVNIAPNSGITLDMGVLEEGDTVRGFGAGGTSAGMNEYHYVNTAGVVETIEAASPSMAFDKAVNIAPNSGVTLDMGVLEEGDTVPLDR